MASTTTVITKGVQGPAGSGGGGGSTPTGTGFVHITGGVQDAAATAINLASAHVTGVLPAANQAAQSLGGVLGGTTAAATYASAAFGSLNISTTGTLAAGSSTLGGTTTLSALAGFGSGIVAVSNTGVLSWSAGGGSMVYPSGTGIVRVSGGSSWGTTGNVALGSEVSGTLPVANLAFGTANQYLVTNAGATAAVWTSAVGDWTGAVSSNIVSRINGITVPTGVGNAIGNSLHITTAGVGGVAAWQALNLAGGANFVTGLLPAGNQSPQTMGGDVTGTTAASTVVALTGTSSAVSIASTAPSLIWVLATASPTIKQAGQTSDTLTQAMTIRAQDAFASAVTNTSGGALNISSGAGTSAGAAGTVNLQTGAVTKVSITPILFTSTSDIAIGAGNMAASGAVRLVNNTFIGWGASGSSAVSAAIVNSTSNNLTYQALAATGHIFQAGASLVENFRVESTGVSVNGAGSYGGGVGVLCLKDATTSPTTIPTSAALIYSEGGMPTLRWKSNAASALDKLQFDSIVSHTIGTQDKCIKVNVISDAGASFSLFIPIYT